MAKWKCIRSIPKTLRKTTTVSVLAKLRRAAMVAEHPRVYPVGNRTAYQYHYNGKTAIRKLEAYELHYNLAHGEGAIHIGAGFDSYDDEEDTDNLPTEHWSQIVFAEDDVIVSRPTTWKDRAAAKLLKQAGYTEPANARKGWTMAWKKDPDTCLSQLTRAATRRIIRYPGSPAAIMYYIECMSWYKLLPEIMQLLTKYKYIWGLRWSEPVETAGVTDMEVASISNQLDRHGYKLTRRTFERLVFEEAPAGGPSLIDYWTMFCIVHNEPSRDLLQGLLAHFDPLAEQYIEEEDKAFAS